MMLIENVFIVLGAAGPYILDLSILIIVLIIEMPPSSEKLAMSRCGWTNQRQIIRRLRSEVNHT